MFLLKPIVKSFGKARKRDMSEQGGAGRLSRLSAFAVEPRMLFDGAAMATAEAMMPTHLDPLHADASAAVATKSVMTLGGGHTNQDPIGYDNARTTVPGQKIWDGQVLQNDGHGNVPATDADGDLLRLTGVVAGEKTNTADVPRTGLGEPIDGQHGTLWLRADGSYWYKPNDGLTVPAGQTLSDVFSYKLCDDKGGEAISTITISLSNASGSDHGLDANPDEYWINNADTITDGNAINGDQNSATPWHSDQADSGIDLRVVGVQAGDTGSDASGSVSQPVAGQFGTLTLNADGSYGYVVNQAGKDLLRGERAQDVFTYTAADTDGHTGTTTITIHLVGLNNPPVGLEHVRETALGTSITDGKVLQPDGYGNGADFDKDGDALSIEGVVAGDVTLPADVPRQDVGNVVAGTYGDLVINRDGTYTYVPHANLNVPAGQTVTDTFSYRLCDQAGGEAVGKIKVEIPGPPSAPPVGPGTPTPSPTPPPDGSTPGGGTPPGGTPGPQLPIVPTGFTDPAISTSGASTPTYSEVGSKPVLPPPPLILPQDPQGPTVFERVKGVVEEAPAMAPALLKAQRQAVKPTDDCVPAPKAKAAVVKPKAVASSVFARPSVAKAVTRPFSEQVKHAAKRPPIAHRVAPTRAPVDKGC